MRVNIYAEEMTQKVSIISKVIDGQEFTGLRFWLELPVTIGGHGANRGDGTYPPLGAHRSVDGTEEVFPPINGKVAQVAGPFIHREGDDDSSAVTFWGKRDLREVLKKALAELDAHYSKKR